MNYEKLNVYTNNGDKGYYRCYHEGKLKRYHRVVWEEHHGPIPEGFDIHHKDMDKANNDISNLELISHKEHSLYHAGWKKKDDGQFYRPCKTCKEVKPRNNLNWIIRKDTGWIHSSSCRVCDLAKKREKTNERRKLEGRSYGKLTKEQHLAKRRLQWKMKRKIK